MKVLFLHGWTSVPDGRKPTFLRNNGHQVLNPPLPDDDFEESIRIAERSLRTQSPDVVVGSSRGGSVAINMQSRNTPLVLLCPAWKRWGTATQTKTNSIILHAKADGVIPFQDSVELAENSRLPAHALQEIGNDHRLADPESLRAMLAACQLLTNRRDS